MDITEFLKLFRVYCKKMKRCTPCKLSKLCDTDVFTLTEKQVAAAIKTMKKGKKYASLD